MMPTTKTRLFWCVTRAAVFAVFYPIGAVCDVLLTVQALRMQRSRAGSDR